MSAKDDGGGSGRRISISPNGIPSINDLDDIGSAVKWMEKGRTDTKGFAKYLPHTSQDLRDGKVTPEQVAGDLKGIYSHTDIRMADTEMDPIMGLSHLSVMRALPGRFFHTEHDHTETSLEFSSDLQSNLFKRMQEHGNKENVSLLLKESVDEVCEMWADRLDKALFRGKTGMFLKKCPLYGVTPETFHKPGMPIRIIADTAGTHAHASWSKEQKIVADFKKDCLLNAAHNVALGLQDVKYMCWECENFAECDIQHCAKCKTARYCSRDCQVSAWKQGHKLKCNALRSRYAAFEKSFKTIDDANKNPTDSAAAAVIECGIALSDEVDYAVLRMITVLPGLYEGTEWGKQLGGRQMEIFYKNIARIARGEFWFYDDADDAAYAVHKEANLTHEKENEYFMGLCMFMGYDYVEMSPSIEFDESSSFVMGMKGLSYGGVMMPASTFIQMYKQGRGATDSTDRFRMRREVRNQCIRDFVDKFHK